MQRWACPLVINPYTIWLRATSILPFAGLLLCHLIIPSRSLQSQPSASAVGGSPRFCPVSNAGRTFSQCIYLIRHPIHYPQQAPHILCKSPGHSTTYDVVVCPMIIVTLVATCLAKMEVVLLFQFITGKAKVLLPPVLTGQGFAPFFSAS